ncbi:hypothetical protein PHSC3_000865 [Chlamydiales bacterium STE3]|nr:hypothetical protein PHSC3_000865 [Chlamydiales bacterium STE3]
MKKKSLKNLALLGLVGGLLSVEQAQAVTPPPSSNSASDAITGLINGRVIPEEELLKELNAEGKKTYTSLDAEGKLLARRVASQYCSGFNECAGLNRCKTEKNSCQGQGSCKGQSTCSVDDKNEAVKLVADKMAKKRAKATQ